MYQFPLYRSDVNLEEQIPALSPSSALSLNCCGRGHSLCSPPLPSAVHSRQLAFAYVDVLVSHWELDQRSAPMGYKICLFCCCLYSAGTREGDGLDEEVAVLAGARIYFGVKWLCSYS